MFGRDLIRVPLAWAVCCSLFLALGCAGVQLGPSVEFDYFVAPAPDDAWSAKIAGWQRRERADRAQPLGGLPSVAGSRNEVAVLGDAQHADASIAAPERDAVIPGTSLARETLRAKYGSFKAKRKREIARDFAGWVQSQAKQHYVADGPVDHWATLEETLRADGDDCDGLELLAYRGLRDLGFRDTEVYRSIVYRPSDGQHHMVTLWFQDPDDPFVIDPTGAMTLGMPRMSELPEWVPVKVFGEREEFSVVSGKPLWHNSPPASPRR